MNTKKIDGSGNWGLFWGASPLPAGAEPWGTVTRDMGDTGALLRLPSGAWVQGNAGVVRSLPPDIVAEAQENQAALLAKIGYKDRSEFDALVVGPATGDLGGSRAE